MCENMNQGFSLNKVTFLTLLILLCTLVLYLHSIILRCYTAHCIVKIKSKIIFQIKMGAGDTTVNKIDTVPALKELTV